MKYNFNIEKIILACEVVGKSSTPFHKNRSSHGLVFFLSEHQYDFSDGTSLVVDKNEIIYLPKNSTYSVKSNEGGCFAINFDYLDPKIFKPFVFKPKNQSISEHFKRAKRFWASKLPAYEIKCKAELYNILYLMQSEFLTNYIHKDKLKIISPAVEFIHLNYTNGVINIEHLAELCDITPEYFRKIFKYFYGESPLIYINKLKIEHAKELLTSNLFSVSEVSELSGFVDASHFSRVFKKITGLPPSHFQ